VLDPDLSVIVSERHAAIVRAELGSGPSRRGWSTTR